VNGELVPLRLMVHFEVSATPLVSVTLARREGSALVGAGTRSIDVHDPLREIELVDPTTGAPTGERVSVAHALAVLYSISRG